MPTVQGKWGVSSEGLFLVMTARTTTSWLLTLRIAQAKLPLPLLCGYWYEI